MQTGFVLTENLGEGVVLVTISRPEALNALNREVLQNLESTITALAADPSLRCLVLTGAGKAFVAGADIKEMVSMTAWEARDFALFGQRIIDLLEEFPRPVIGAINGFALGGGCELAMACDFRIAGEKARFGQPEVNLGVTPGFGGTQRLSRLVGVAQARYLLYTGEMITAQRALEIGLVQEVVPQESLLERCTAVARTIASKGPVAVSLCKSAVNNGAEMDLARGLQVEAACFAQCFATSDQSEGMAAFVEKRQPKFENK